MATIDFTSAYRDATQGSTLKALAARRAEVQAANAAMRPREVKSPWQGAANIADTISGAIREGRLANEEAKGRTRFAELLAGGLAPDEIGEAMGLDPDTAMKYQERTWAKEDFDTKEKIRAGERTEDRGWAVKDAVTRVEEARETARLNREAEAGIERQKIEDAAAAGKIDIITDEEATALDPSLDPTQRYAVSKDGTSITVIPPAAKQKSSRLLSKEEISASPNLDPTKAYEIDETGNINPVETVSSGITINTGEIEARKNLAAELGLREGTPEYIEYVATGKYTKPKGPGDMTVYEKKLTSDADQLVADNQMTIDTLKSIIAGPEGQTLNDRAGTGWWSKIQPALARNDPIGIFDDATGEATTELNTKIMSQAYESLKAIFGGQPTEGERKALEQLQASTDKSPTERKIIIEYAIGEAQKRLDLNRQKADQLRGKEYFKPGGGTSTEPATDTGGGDYQEGDIVSSPGQPDLVLRNGQWVPVQ